MVTTSRVQQNTQVQPQTLKEAAFDEMYDALLDAPIPFDAASLYADWYSKVCRPAVRLAARAKREVK